MRYICVLNHSSCIVLSLGPQLPRVHDILPYDIAARCHGNDRSKIGIGHPDSKYCILLSEALAATDIVVTAFAHEFSDAELPGTRHQCGQSQHPHHVRVEMTVHYRTKRKSDGYYQRNTPQVKSKVSAQPHNHNMYFRQEFSQCPRCKKRGNK